MTKLERQEQDRLLKIVIRNLRNALIDAIKNDIKVEDSISMLGLSKQFLKE